MPEETAPNSSPPGRFTGSPVQSLRKAATKWRLNIGILYQNNWPFRWLIQGFAILIPAILGGMVAMRISRAGWGWDVAATEFLTSPGAAGVAAVLAASIAAVMLNRQIESTREAEKIRLDHDREVEESRSWWENFEWVTSRALNNGPNDPELPPELAVTVLQDLQGWAPNDTQKTACGVLVGHLTSSVIPHEFPQEAIDLAKTLKTDQEQEVGHKNPRDSKDRVRTTEELIAGDAMRSEAHMKALRHRINRLSGETEIEERVSEAVTKYLQATDGSPAFSDHADKQLYRNRVLESIFAGQLYDKYLVRMPPTLDSPAAPDAILQRPSDDRALNVYVIPHKSPLGRRSQLLAIETAQDPDTVAPPFFIFRDEPERVLRGSIERQRGHYAVWKDDADTATMLEKALKVLWGQEV